MSEILRSTPSPLQREEIDGLESYLDISKLNISIDKNGDYEVSFKINDTKRKLTLSSQNMDDFLSFGTKEEASPLARYICAKIHASISVGNIGQTSRRLDLDRAGLITEIDAVPTFSLEYNPTTKKVSIDGTELDLILPADKFFEARKMFNFLLSIGWKERVKQKIHQSSSEALHDLQPNGKYYVDTKMVDSGSDTINIDNRVGFNFMDTTALSPEGIRKLFIINGGEDYDRNMRRAMDIIVKIINSTIDTRLVAKK